MNKMTAQNKHSPKNGAQYPSPHDRNKALVLGLFFNLLVCLLLVYLVMKDAAQQSLRGEMLLACLFGILETIICTQSLHSLLHTMQRNDHLRESVTQLEGFNRSMRAQRHDLKNHLQVLSALLDMDEFDEAKKYLHNVTDDFQVVTRAIRTSEPAVNALLQAKQSICDELGIAFDLEVTTPLDHLPMESWTFCRILGNLIDNAIEALHEANTNPARILVHLSEADHYYHARVENNGPPIPEKTQNAIFRPGYSSKGTGRGLGLSIVHELISSRGGRINVASDAQSTAFSFVLPRRRARA